MDRQLARHLVSLYYKVPVVPASPLAQDFLMDYIAYARRHIQPEVSGDVARLPPCCSSGRKSCRRRQYWHGMLDQGMLWFCACFRSHRGGGVSTGCATCSC